MDKQLVVSSSPHIRSVSTTSGIMLDVIIALLPTAVVGTIFFGLRALLVMLTCVVSSVAAEAIFNLAAKKKQTVGDLSAVVTGLILALNLRADIPLWQCAIGSIFAIVVVKCFFGGLGCNFANPAITGRIFMMLCFSATVGGGAALVFGGQEIIDLTSGATPLAVMAAEVPDALPSLFEMFLGFKSGAIGEVSGAAIVIGFLYLVIRRVIKFEVPLIFVGGVYVMSVIISGNPTFALYQILSGGLLFGAVFMATDYVTTPITRLGKMIFAFGCALVTVLIRFYGNYPEGVSYAILLMNIISPYIEKWTLKSPLGGAKA